MKKDLIYKISVICSFMVVGIHSYNIKEISEINIASVIEGILSHGLFMSAVPIFFILSGFLFYRNIDSLDSVYKKIKKRVKTILIPFISWSTIYYCFFAIGSKMNLLNKNIDISLMGGLKGILFYEYVFPLWFMFILMVFVLISPGVFYLLRKKIAVVIILVLAVLLGIMQIDLKFNVDGLDRVLFPSNFFAYYFIGAILGYYFNKDILKKLKKFSYKIPNSALIIAICILSLGQSLIFDEVLYSFNDRIMVPFIVVVVLIIFMKNLDNIQFHINVSTMIIYGIHPMVGIILGQIFSYFHFRNSLTVFLTSWLLNIIISCVISKICQKNKVLNIVLNGNRN